jgi:hypothetical protein
LNYSKYRVDPQQPESLTGLLSLTFTKLVPFSVKITCIVSSGSIWTEFGALIALSLTLLHMTTNRNRGTWCVLPDGPASCYRALGAHLGSSCWEPSEIHSRILRASWHQNEKVGSVWGLAPRRWARWDSLPGPLLARTAVSRGSLWKTLLGRGGEKHGPSLCPGQGEEGEGDEEGEKSGTTKKEKSAKGTKKTNGTAKKEEMLMAEALRLYEELKQVVLHRSITPALTFTGRGTRWSSF